MQTITKKKLHLYFFYKISRIKFNLFDEKRYQIFYHFKLYVNTKIA